MGRIIGKLLMFIVACVIFLSLFYYAYRSSQAERLITSEEYLESIQQASRGRQLAGDDTVNIFDDEIDKHTNPPSVIDSFLSLIRSFLQ